MNSSTSASSNYTNNNTNTNINNNIVDMPTPDESPISEFYAGKSILITGATGFIGKVLIEKLLYSCSSVKKIYLLIRSSKGRSARDRMLDMIEQKPFSMRLKKSFILSKLVAIESDLALKGLGLSEESKRELIDQVALVFHVAASVKFEAPLEVNMRHNVVATKELLELACHFKHLLTFVHVSTAYSNCQLLHIDERVYHMQVPEDPMKLEVSKQMIDNRPNTYTYTKAMAENVVQLYAHRLNLSIVRPSIVMSSLKEPAEGWVDTINGPVGLSVLGALGILQKIKVNSEVVFDLIPVDIVTNALLSIAWATTQLRHKFNTSTTAPARAEPRKLEQVPEQAVSPAAKRPALKAKPNGPWRPLLFGRASSGGAGQQKQKSADESENQSKQDELATCAAAAATCDALKTTTGANGHNKPNQADGRLCVFNLTTGSENPCSFYDYFNTGRQEACQKPSVRALRPLLHIPKQKGMNPVQYWIHKIFSHLLFAYLMDFLLGLFGQKRMVVKAVNKMHHANEMFDYFCSNQWNFNTDNVKQLRLLQSANDKQAFNCDVRQIDWSLYSRLGWIGCRRFILKESDESMAYAKRRYTIINYLTNYRPPCLLAAIRRNLCAAIWLQHFVGSPRDRDVIIDN